MNRLAEPLLDALGIPPYLMAGPAALPCLELALADSRTRETPVAVLVVTSTMQVCTPWQHPAPSPLNRTCAGVRGGAATLGAGIAPARPDKRGGGLDGDGSLLFFFQAEDGIRDRNVTGVQTCALPI